MRLRNLLIIVVVVIVGVAAILYVAVRHVSKMAGDAYVATTVADMVDEFIDSHDGAWPRGWDDLRTLNGQPVDPQHLATLRALVDVDWTADPRALAAMIAAKDGDPPCKVVWLRNGNRVLWADRDPNRIIWHHLQERIKHAQTRPASGPTTRGEHSGG